MIFDTHLHLIDRSRLSYPWLAGFAALDHDWRFADYLTAARRLGITDVLHMEVDVAEDMIDAESAFVADQMALPGSPMRGAISAARPEQPGFPAWLERADRRVIKGVRRVLHVMPDDLSRQPLFRENLRRLGSAGLPFDLCVLPRQMPQAIELADACPDTTFILDHCGVPAIAAGDLASWAGPLAEIAQRPNVCAKISGITAYAAPNWTLESLRPYVEHVIAVFGWDRVVWGSDSPVCTLQSTLDQWVGVTHALLAGASSSEKDWLLSANARRIWGIQARPDGLS